jgi:CBS domain-containing protein
MARLCPLTGALASTCVRLTAEYDCGNRHYQRGGRMQVREGMSETVLTVGPGHTLREASRLMSQRKVGAAIVIDPDQPGPGILTERDMLDSLGAGQDPDVEKVADHLSATLTFAAPDWSLERAAEAMVRGGFRHLVIVDGGETVGVLSMRDIVRCWTDAGASCDVDDKLSAA